MSEATSASGPGWGGLWFLLALTTFATIWICAFFLRRQRDAHLPCQTHSQERTVSEPTAVPTVRLRALVALLYPDHMTPTAKRQIENVVEEYEDA